MTMEIIGTTKLELLFRRVAGLDVDKGDLRRLSDFVNHKLYDLLLIGQAVAKANNRDMIEPWDLPITKGLQQRMAESKEFEGELAHKPVLEKFVTLPMLDMGYSIGTEEIIPEVAAALIISLAKVFKILDADLKNPQTQHWEQALRIFDAVL
jgi:hypothetical protein